jgi:hypothetical protein
LSSVGNQAFLPQQRTSPAARQLPTRRRVGEARARRLLAAMGSTASSARSAGPSRRRSIVSRAPSRDGLYRRIRQVCGALKAAQHRQLASRVAECRRVLGERIQASARRAQAAAERGPGNVMLPGQRGRFRRGRGRCRRVAPRSTANGYSRRPPPHPPQLPGRAACSAVSPSVCAGVAVMPRPLGVSAGATQPPQVSSSDSAAGTSTDGGGWFVAGAPLS